MDTSLTGLIFIAGLIYFAAAENSKFILFFIFILFYSIFFLFIYFVLFYCIFDFIALFICQFIFLKLQNEFILNVYLHVGFNHRHSVGNCSRRQSDNMFSHLFPKWQSDNMFSHFFQQIYFGISCNSKETICTKMSKIIFLGKNSKMPSAEMFTKHAKRLTSIDFERCIWHNAMLMV